MKNKLFSSFSCANAPCIADEKSLKRFLSVSKYVLVFFVLLDSLTTWGVIRAGIGYESNPLLSGVILLAGFAGLLILKCAYVGVIYCVYRIVPQETYSYCASFSTAAGIMLCFNNLLVLLGHPGMIPYLGGVF